MQDTNSTMTLEADDVMLLERNEARDQGIPLFTAHWHLFAPTIIILFSYSFSWAMLAASGNSGTNLARLFIVVMAIFVPLLAAHAFLRYQTIRVQVNEDDIICHPGWPKDLPIDVPLSLIDRLVVKRGLAGRLFGGGTLVIHLKTDSKVAIADLAEPDLAKAKIEEAMASAD